MTGLVLFRVSARSASDLHNCRLRGTKAVLARSTRVLQEFETQCPAVAELLHRTVPRLDKELRRKALALKRLVHKADPLARVHFEALLPYVEPEEASQLSRLELLADEYRQCLTAAEQLYVEEVAAASDHLWDLVRQDDFQEALYTWNKLLWAEVKPLLDSSNLEQISRRHRDQLETILFRYLQLSSLKTTPHGLWCTVAPGFWGAETNCKWSPNSSKRLTQPNRSWLRAIVSAKLQSAPVNCPMFVNPTLSQEADQLFFWRWASNGQLELCEIPADDQLLEILEAFRSDTPRERMTELGWDCDQVGQIVNELVEAGLMWPSLDAAYAVERPVADLSNWLEQVTSDQNVAALRDELQTLDTELLGIDQPSLSWSDRRVRYTALTSRFPMATNDRTTPFRVDVRGPWAQASLGLDKQFAVFTAGRQYSRLFAALYGWRDPLSDYKLAFRDRFGFNRPVSLLRVESELGHPFPSSHLKDNAYEGRRVFHEPRTPKARVIFQRFHSAVGELVSTSDDEVSLSGLEDLLEAPPFPLPPAAEMVYQLSRDDNQDRVCIEMLSSQVGRLVWRHAPLLTPEERSSLVEDILRNLPPLPKDTIRAGVIHATQGENDNLAYHSGFLGHEIEIYGPRSSLPPSRVSRIGDLCLELCPDTNQFILRCKRSGARIMPWFPSTLTTRKDGLVALLDALPTQGFVNVTGHARSRFHPYVAWQRTPRLTWGPLVLSRQRWTIPVSAITWKDKTQIREVEAFKEATQLQRRAGLPDFVYAYTDSNDKPIPAHFDDPWSVVLLGKLAQQAREFVFFEEALPSPESHLAKGPSGDPYATEIWSIVPLT